MVATGSEERVGERVQGEAEQRSIQVHFAVALGWRWKEERKEMGMKPVSWP
jgi:hypothetical protein